MPPSPSDARQTDPQTIRFPFDANFNGLLEEDLIQQVFDAYSEYDGPTLSNITHEAESPWDQVWIPGERDQPIPDDIIEAYYEGLARRAAA